MRRTWVAGVAGLALAGLVPVPAAAAPPVPVAAADCSADAALLGFSDALDGATFRGTQVAGLSALAADGADRALALVDNIGTTPARFYDLALPDLAVRKVTTLSRPDGTPYTGADFDGEGLVLERRTILASSETEPSIRRFDRRTGRQVGALPVPARFRVAPAGEATANQTFEGLTRDGATLYAGTEGALAPDGAGNLRILEYAHDRPVAQYAYRADAGLGLSELLAVGDGTLLVLERGFTAGVGNTVRVYRATLTGARDVTGVASLAAAGTPFLAKTPVVDLSTCPPSGATAKQPQPNPLLDNYEAMAFGPTLRDGRRTLRILSDDNRSATQTTRLLTLAVTLPPEPVLRARAILPATDYQPGPVSGTQLPPTPVNGVTPPFPGQPIPGFSAILPYRRGSTDRFLAQPDNGFGAKTNSADYLLRIYDVSPDWRRHTVRVNGFLQLRDPGHEIPFPLTRADRLLTGADLDTESLAYGADGTLWIGDEFGPFLVNVDRTGKVLRAPVPLPDGRVSPQSPYLPPGGTATVPASGGFEALAGSRDGRTLYPILERAVTDDPDQRRRVVYEFDTRRGAYTGRTWDLRVSSPELFVGDAQVLSGRKILFIERDNLDGPAAVVKRLVVADLDRRDATGAVSRRTAVDLLRIRDPYGVSTPARDPAEFGVGPLFRFPFVSVETVLPLGGGRLLVANDNNFPFDDGRIPGRPDDTELAVLSVPGLR